MMKLSRNMMLVKLENELMKSLDNVEVVHKDEENHTLCFIYEDVYVETYVRKREFIYDVYTKENSDELHKCRDLVHGLTTRYVEEFLWKVYENDILSKIYKSVRDHEVRIHKLEDEKMIITLDDKIKIYTHVIYDEIITTIYDLVNKEYIMNEEILYVDEFKERVESVLNEM